MPDILRSYEWGFIEELIISPSGNIRITGWSSQTEFPEIDVWINDESITLQVAYRTFRPDVSDHLQESFAFWGFELLYQFHSSGIITVFHNGEKIAEEENMVIKSTHYENLMNTQNVLHRENIYGYGPPADHVNDEVFNIVQNLEGSVLDFGCGKGNTLKYLRSNGIEAHGIEIDREEIRESVFDEVKSFITLYDGTLPTPYQDHSFDNVICVEVLEHIPEYEKMIQEFRRIARNKVVITVPDIGAIPLCYHHGVVPWHLLELTHVNFFTLNSLQSLLVKYFSKVQMMKICPIQINDLRYYNNLVAICEK